MLLPDLPKDLAEAVNKATVDSENPNKCNVVNKVIYRLHQEGEEVEWAEDICFARMISFFRSNNKVYDEKKPIFFHYKLTDVSQPEQKKVFVPWVSLIQKLGLFKDQHSAEEILEKGMVLEIDEKISPFEFYLQAALVRYARDEPHFVDNVLNFVEAGSDFWAAFFYCHIGGLIAKPGHSITQYPPYGGIKHGAVRFPLSMNRQTSGKGRVDSRSLLQILKDGRKGTGEVSWNIYSNIDRLGFSCQLTTDPPERSIHPVLYPLYRVDSTGELSEVLQHLKEEHDIVFT